MKKLLYLFIFISSLSFAQDGGLKTLTATEFAANTYRITEAIPVTYDSKERFQIKFPTDNTGAITLNRAGLGLRDVRKNDGTALASGDITANTPYLIGYNSVGGYYVCETCGGSGGGTTETASNGLTKVVNDIQLGGALTTNTTVSGAFNLGFTNTAIGVGVAPGSITANTKLDVRGVASNNIARFSSSTNTNPITFLDNGNITVSGTLTGLAGGLALGFSGGQSFGSASGVFQAQILGSTFAEGTSWTLTTNQTATSGNQNLFRIGFNAGNGFAPTSGTATHSTLRVQDLINQTGGANGQVTIINADPTITAAVNVNGFDWNPTNPGNISGSHLAFRSTSGSNVFGHTSLSSNSNRMELRGIGTTTGYGLILRSSSGTNNFGFRDDGKMFHFITPANDNALTDIIVRDGATGELKYRTVASLPGGGSGDVVGPASATDNAISRFDTGTGKLIQNSAVSIDDNGNVSIGTASIAGDKSITVLSSSSNASLDLVPKGNSPVQIGSRYFQIGRSTDGDTFRTLSIDGSATNIVFDIYSKGPTSWIDINGHFQVFDISSLHRANIQANTYAGLSFKEGNSFFKLSSYPVAASTADFILNTEQEGGDTANPSGNIYLDTEAGSAATVKGNIGMFSQSVNFQSMQKGMYVRNRHAAPTAAPSNGFFHYSNSGVPTWRTSTNNTIFLETQAAVTTSQGIADALTSLGLLSSSTISSGGTYYAPSSLAANATDADFTAVANSIKHLPAATLTANRTITIPTGADGDVIELHNNEAVYVWNLAGATVYLADRTTVVTQLLYNVPTLLQKINGLWIIKN